MVVYTIDNIKFVLTQKDLDLFCATYNIPADLGPELPGLEDTIKDSLEVKIGIYTRLIEFANFCIPLSRFLLCVLQYYQINFSQLFVLAATKIDASVCPIFVPWYNNVSVKKDPLPSDDIVDFEPLEKLDNNRTMITKYPETLMCLVGFILSFFDPTAHPTLLCRDKSDPSKIKTGERTFTPGEVPLLTKTADMVVNPSPKRSVFFNTHAIRLVAHDDNVRTCPPSGRYVVLSSSSADTNILTSPQVVLPVPFVQVNADIVATEPVDETHGRPFLG
ncbi:hypothetical protein Tco_1119334 [Tanacetum coccineum]